MNLFNLPALPLSEEFCERLLSGHNLYVERIVSTGQSSPDGFWYDQANDEWVVLLQGQARLAWPNGRTQDLKAGDCLFIPAHERHRVDRTSQEPPCVWLAIHGALKLEYTACTEHQP